ncbi:glycosyltransferase family 2 protein [Streptomyces sp. 4.24]|uniref:glycosyltransferase family 2 protein n=1 Tax=Streptomyces tritrimontium TaxID=3406573 RepID=UPI003BB53DCE
MQSEYIPDVSVVIAVYNAMPYLRECLDSVVTQSIGVERIEVIAVNDGSTDGSGEELDRYAARYPQIRVLHQANTGGPSVPRNRAFDMARGRYVFVVDADDYLGPEALDRLVKMADSQGSDVVLAKQVGLGRTVSVKAHVHAEHADLYTSEVYRSLGSQKLIRRQVIEHTRIRYPEDLWFGEDQIFVTAVYLAARKISVVGNYDCYFARKRTDGQNITARVKTSGETVEHIERVMRMVAEGVQDPVGRRRMLARHFRAILGKALIPAARLRPTQPNYAAEVYWRCKALCDAYWTPEMYADLPHIDRIRMYCFLYGAIEAFEQLAPYNPAKTPPAQIVDNGRVYRAFPFFRDHSVGLPDALFEITDILKVSQRLDSMAWKGNRFHITGQGYIVSLGAGQMATELCLRMRETGVEHVVPVTPRPSNAPVGGLTGFEVSVDLANIDGRPIEPGTWDLVLYVRTEGVMRPARFGKSAVAGLDRTARRPKVVAKDPASGTELAATVFFTVYDNLSIDVSRRFPLPATVPAHAG